jgi:hypothetical protein
VTTAGSQPGAKACRSSVTESVQYVRTDRVTEDRQASLRLILVPSWRCVARRVPSQGTPGSTRKPEAAGQAPGAPNRPETGQNERERNRSTPKSRRIRRGRSAGCLRLTRQMLQPRGLLTRHRLARRKHPARGVPPARRPRLEICSDRSVAMLSGRATT